MPKHTDAMDRLVGGGNLDCDRFPYGSSATASGPVSDLTREFQSEYIAGAVALAWDDLSLLERAVYCLRYEVHPYWTQDEVAAIANVTQSAISQAETRICEQVRRHILILRSKG